MQSKIKVLCGGMLAILIAMWPPFGSPGQNTLPAVDSVQKAKQVIRANVDTIRGINTYIREKAKEVPEIKPVVPPRVYSSWLDRLIRSRRKAAVPVKKTSVISQAPVSESRPNHVKGAPVIIYRECKPYPGAEPRGMTEKEYRDYRGPIYKLLHPIKRHEK